MLLRRIPRFALALAAALSQPGCDAMCAHNELSSVISPDGRREAVVFLQSCFVGNRPMVNVAIHRVGSARTSGRAVSIADTTSVTALPDYPWGPVLRVSVRWESPTQLVVVHDARALFDVRKSRRDGVAITYVVARP
jgi:hypothetical protein